MSEQEHGDWPDEDLLEWLLDDQARTGVEREALEAGGDVGERLRELEAFLGDCRQALAEESSKREAPTGELVDRILASTTREDFSWRGDLRLVGGFLRQRLRSSLLLRVVAASLLLHIAVLPVLAYYTLVAISEPQLEIDFEKRPLDMPYDTPDPEPEREVTRPPDTDLESGSLARELRLQRLARSGAIDLDGLADLPPDTEVWQDELGLILWCEQLMDELDGAEGSPGRLRQLEFALTTLREQLASPGRDATDRLAASAWLRAGAEGWVEPDPAGQTLLADGELLTGESWLRTYREADRAER